VVIWYGLGLKVGNWLWCGGSKAESISSPRKYYGGRRSRS
jgi:hypothetical protein